MEDQNKYLGYIDRDGERYLVKDISAHKKINDILNNINKTNNEVSEVKTSVESKAEKIWVNETFETKTAANNKADRSTTLSGYGISDAYTSSEIDLKLLDINSTITSKTEDVLNTVSETYATKENLEIVQNSLNNYETIDGVNNKTENLKTEINNRISSLTLNSFDNDTGYITAASLIPYATQNYVDGEITKLSGVSADTVETLNRLKDALNNDESFATTITTQLGEKTNETDFQNFKNSVYTKEEIDTKNFITNAELEAKSYATIAEIENLDIGSYLKTIDAVSLIDSTVNDKLTEVNLDKYELKGVAASLTNTLKTTIENKLTDYATINSVDEKIGNIFTIQENEDHLIETINANAYTKSEVDEKISKVQPSIDLTSYAKTEDINRTLEDYTKTANLSTVATTGSYNDLIDKPDLTNIKTINKASELINDIGFVTETAVYSADDLKSKYLYINGEKTIEKEVILQAGNEYILEGSLIDGHIKIVSEVTPTEKTILNLNGVYIKSDVETAINYTPNKKTLVVELMAEKNNIIETLTDNIITEFSSLAAIYSENNIEVKGLGYLVIKNNYKSHGIKASGDLEILDRPHIYINNNAGHDGLHGDNVIIYNGIFSLNNCNDGIGAWKKADANAADNPKKGNLKIFGGKYTFNTLNQELFDCSENKGVVVKSPYFEITNSEYRTGNCKFIDINDSTTLTEYYGTGMMYAVDSVGNEVELTVDNMTQDIYGITENVASESSHHFYNIPEVFTRSYVLKLTGYFENTYFVFEGNTIVGNEHGAEVLLSNVCINNTDALLPNVEKDKVYCLRYTTKAKSLKIKSDKNTINYVHCTNGTAIKSDENNLKFSGSGTLYVVSDAKDAVDSGKGITLYGNGVKYFSTLSTDEVDPRYAVSAKEGFIGIDNDDFNDHTNKLIPDFKIEESKQIIYANSVNIHMNKNKTSKGVLTYYFSTTSNIEGNSDTILKIQTGKIIVNKDIFVEANTIIQPADFDISSLVFSNITDSEFSLESLRLTEPYEKIENLTTKTNELTTSISNITGEIGTLNDSINLINVKVPTPPTVEGSYILKCTISAEGTPSYSWEAETTTTV